ncbi:hypothetical protein SAMN06295937_101639 [Sphingopyxis flava]|uniref:Uncharacterized protein n=1 Tax=Sphingopyxis flava TaxID=1507287 RepID=A0A1T5DT81_9SPHN|nr:hypothetical protein SAMN06295937_101639 [Sphingopyxis flava]
MGFAAHPQRGGAKSNQVGRHFSPSPKRPVCPSFLEPDPNHISLQVHLAASGLGGAGGKSDAADYASALPVQLVNNDPLHAKHDARARHIAEVQLISLKQTAALLALSRRRARETIRF